jgi:hypothetical protein
VEILVTVLLENCYPSRVLPGPPKTQMYKTVILSVVLCGCEPNSHNLREERV